MKIECFLVLIASLVVFSNVYAGSTNLAHEEETMCQSNEKVYFSCPVDKEVISVCAFGNFSPKTGYIKYRLGNPGKPEFEFPVDVRPPMDIFSVSDLYGKNISTTLLKFNSGKYIYVVFQSAVSGVYVKKMDELCVASYVTLVSMGTLIPKQNEGLKQLRRMTTISYRDSQSLKFRCLCKAKNLLVWLLVFSLVER